MADGNIGPEDGVKAYRSDLEKLGIKPARSFEDDMVLLTPGLK